MNSVILWWALLNQCVANWNSAQGVSTTKQGLFCLTCKTVAPPPPVRVKCSADSLADSGGGLCLGPLVIPGKRYRNSNSLRIVRSGIR